MRSIQEIFDGDFSEAFAAVVQKVRPDENNLRGIQLGYSESWPSLAISSDVLVLAVRELGTRRRQIYAGFINDAHPSIVWPGRFRFYVDHFRELGVHDLDETSDADFYGTGGGGGARNYVPNITSVRSKVLPPADENLEDAIPEGSMELRLVWVRKNHHHFRDLVWKYWEGRCSVTDADCDGLLVASHIHPWASSASQEKTDFHNGLLLAAPLDSLFDRGWISFLDTGTMIVQPNLSVETRKAFGVQENGMRIRKVGKISQKMKDYLKRHRRFYGFE